MSGWHVVKVGGSLLEWSELPEYLSAWLAQQVHAQCVLIAGGGEIVESIRRAGLRWNLAEERCHWLAIDAMRITAHLLAALLPETSMIDDWQDLIRYNSNSKQQHPVIFETTQFLREVEPGLSPAPLPHTWQVTSDSIAARVAVALDAAQLTLLKSADAPLQELAELAQQGYVDQHFATVAATIPKISFVNLRG